MTDDDFELATTYAVVGFASATVVVLSGSAASVLASGSSVVPSPGSRTGASTVVTSGVTSSEPIVVVADASGFA